MKNSFATFVAVLVTLCTTSTALADTPTPSGNATLTALSAVPQFYYSDRKEVPPRVINDIRESTIKAEIGERVTFWIEFVGMPMPNIEIFHNDQPISSGVDGYYITTVDSKCILVIEYVFPEDAGKYKFKLKNSSGECAVVFTLEVKDE